jgi:hypothetical protein
MADIYISNDAPIVDYLYINNKNGTFTGNGSIWGISVSFQWAIMFPILTIPDIFTLDMLPEDNHRQSVFSP